jgi:hypothetical protein
MIKEFENLIILILVIGTNIVQIEFSFTNYQIWFCGNVTIDLVNGYILEPNICKKLKYIKNDYRSKYLKNIFNGRNNLLELLYIFH